jgi:hypothetical protein
LSVWPGPETLECLQPLCLFWEKPLYIGQSEHARHQTTKMSMPPRVTEVDQFTERFKEAEETLSKTEQILANCLSIALDAPKSPRVTEEDRARWSQEAALVSPKSPRVTEEDRARWSQEAALVSPKSPRVTEEDRARWSQEAALDSPKSPRVTEEDRFRWHKEAVLELEKAERKYAMCMSVTNERRKDLDVAWKKQLESRGDVSIAKCAQECTVKLEEAKDAEIGAQLDVDRRRALARETKRKWEDFGCEENAEFKKKLRASGMEPVKFPQPRIFTYSDSDEEEDEGGDDCLKYHPSSPRFTPEPSSPGFKPEPASAWQCVCSAMCD